MAWLRFPIMIEAIDNLMDFAAKIGCEVYDPITAPCLASETRDEIIDAHKKVLENISKLFGRPKSRKPGRS